MAFDLIHEVFDASDMSRIEGSCWVTLAGRHRWASVKAMRDWHGKSWTPIDGGIEQRRRIGTSDWPLTIVERLRLVPATEVA